MSSGVRANNPQSAISQLPLHIGKPSEFLLLANLYAVRLPDGTEPMSPPKKPKETVITLLFQAMLEGNGVLQLFTYVYELYRLKPCVSGFTIYCINASEMGLGKSQRFWDKISRTRIWTKICKDMHQGPMNSCAKGFQHISNGFRATAVQSPILDLAIFL